MCKSCRFVVLHIEIKKTFYLWQYIDRYWLDLNRRILSLNLKDSDLIHSATSDYKYWKFKLYLVSRIFSQVRDWSKYIWIYLHVRRERIDNVFKGGGKSWSTFFQIIQSLTPKYFVTKNLMQVTYNIIHSLNDRSSYTFKTSKKTTIAYM